MPLGREVKIVGNHLEIEWTGPFTAGTR